MQQGGIASQALPVALERERDAPVDAQRGENTPTAKQAHLSRAQNSFIARDDCIVVENEAVNHTLIMSMAAERPRLAHVEQAQAREAQQLESLAPNIGLLQQA